MYRNKVITSKCAYSNEQKTVNDFCHEAQKHKQAICPLENFFKKNIERIMQENNHGFWCFKLQSVDFSYVVAVCTQFRVNIQTDANKMCAQDNQQGHCGFLKCLMSPFIQLLKQ